ncbi:hypothetical protein FHS51_000942 [Sphingobium wenxiniae]|uniref:Uncharacterized protein n=1 Tax=Sphingobium wenxiniae (strain DSM 21828 / CGMCC 1.7748 / JZ-1) TaxID=595605 RepID=A0A562KH02_SPHWJ|nr:hypothetical protein [Sphingobium wenxiniae]TWH94503.1 hypothetical protein IQ35_01746 [Sphingobium wenxiniae]
MESKSPQQVGQIIGAMLVHCADEPEGKMKLVVTLPARACNSLHECHQAGSYEEGWANGNEQSVHRPHIGFRPGFVMLSGGLN